MKQLTETWKKIERIAARDTRYKTQAYSFVMAAVEYTINALEEPRHVTAVELLEGIRQVAMKQYGPMAKQVFDFWGVGETQDFGNIVYNLIDEGLLSRNDRDSIEDFASVYDFTEIFEREYYGDC
jgi:uncharacterized repeat protein (TIGR04138 family)